VSELDSGGVARKLIDAMNAHDLDAVGSLANERIKFLDVAAGEEIDGRRQWRDYCGRYLTGFSDLQIELVNLIVGDDTAVAEAVAHGTHDGPLLGPGGEIPPTGNTIAVPFCFVLRVDGGEILDSREYYDAITLMTQLGLMPPSPGPGDAP